VTTNYITKAKIPPETLKEKDNTLGAQIFFYQITETNSFIIIQFDKNCSRTLLNTCYSAHIVEVRTDNSGNAG
jgi:hypothetical protein